MVRFTGPDQFATFFYGELDLKTRRFTYSNAGHNPPLVIRADGRLVELATGGLVLGFMSDVIYEEASVSLAPGDTLFLYTDGITEARNDQDEEFGEERLFKLLQEMRRFPPDQLLESVFLEADRFAAGELLQQDDTTLVALRLESQV
jgi:sigma-B regulation protein RsbU (phosphoserine phosphatase)